MKTSWLFRSLYFFGGLCDLCSDSRAQFNYVLLTLSTSLSLSVSPLKRSADCTRAILSFCDVVDLFWTRCSRLTKLYFLEYLHFLWIQRQLKPLKNRYKKMTLHKVLYFNVKQHRRDFCVTKARNFRSNFCNKNVTKCKIIANLSVNNSLFISESRVFAYN